MGERFDVIVIGGGHAGAEASALASRAGARTLLVTQSLETIGQMSCNPAIGGIAKGTVVREIDALGGVMGRATDLSRIQFRMLNRSKGPAVWSPRAQCDRGLYRRAVRGLLERQARLHFAQGTVGALTLVGGRVAGVALTDGRRYSAPAIVVTAGTFLRGRIHMGTETTIPAGRAGDAPSIELAQVLAYIGLSVQRFKTGTPPRIDGRTVDFSSMTRQDGDPAEYRFSVYEWNPHPAQLPCYLTWTGPALQTLIMDQLGKSALYGGAISGRGPRYCPSIEDKVVKFPDAERHQVFLEPEGLDTTEMYVNGLSTSLPPDVQLSFLQTIPGLEQVRMTRPGYAIEYDYFPPTQLTPALQVAAVPGLFLAGQVNGTTGYEEAAGQGVVAGLNAAAFATGREPIVFGRGDAFLGVLVDDLVTRGVDEPYRLFTSRSEYRLLLRQDNALRRLFPLAQRLGILSDGEASTAQRRLEREEVARRTAETTSVEPHTVNPILQAAECEPVAGAIRVADLARRPRVPTAHVLRAAGWEGQDSDAEWADIELKYEGYLAREQRSVQRMQAMDEVALPAGLDYRELRSLSFEAREKLTAARPASIGQASRIPGVSPSDVQGLIYEVVKRRGS